MGSIPVRVTMTKIQCLAHWIFLRLRPPKAVSQPLFPGFPQSYSHSPQTYPQGLNRFVPVSGRWGEWHPPFVGAMKIARNVAVFGRWGEWYPPLPAPSLRELARPTGVTEGVSFDGCSMPMIYTPAHFGSEIFGVYVHRSTLPQSRIRSTAPSEREPGTAPSRLPL